MASPHPDDSLLLIRCPSCSQRFKVGEDLRERTVECGGCEHRFKINDEVIVRTKKFYPGERSGPALNRFQRVPLHGGGETQTAFKQMRYGNMPDPAVLEPASPQRIIAGAVGVAGMAFMALLLMFGGNRGGMLDGMVFSSRLLMAAFACLVGVLALVYANPKARLKAMSVGLLLVAGLMAVPFFFTTGSVPLEQQGKGSLAIPTASETKAGDKDAEGTEDAEIVALRIRIGTGPLVSEIEKLAREDSSQRAMGLWLRGLDNNNKLLVRDYILRVTNADPTSHLYPREGGDYLMVVTRISQTLQELSALAAAIGPTERIYPDISVIEVQVRNENFVEGSLQKLSDKDDPAFYDLNKRELESIDLQRVERAVQRLGGAEPKIYRADISRKLIELLSDDSVTFKGTICSALAVWAEEPGPAGQAALTEVKRLMLANQEVPREIVVLVVKERNPGIIPLLETLWKQNPTHWESLYGDYGPAVEPSLLKAFPETEGMLRYSAVRLLGRVGGADSLPVLETVSGVTDPELRVLIEQAQRSIRSRAGQ
ncbi:MAG: hypothetical protein EOP85_03730 [Verrucomicrobiaceae bacterium]|nr:MAG: hypothetical protein EOP85_03730 [Verrucomicrobiaceae bacterium]